MPNPEPEKDTSLATVANSRRSTRIFQAIPLSVSGQNRTGNLFLDSTSAVSVNCHGCLYPSRYEYRHGSWVTIEVPDQQANSLPRPVRAQVKFIRLPRNPNELYLVGVELEKPANVWGIKTSPEDWLQFLELSAPGPNALPPAGAVPAGVAGPQAGQQTREQPQPGGSEAIASNGSAIALSSGARVQNAVPAIPLDASAASAETISQITAAIGPDHIMHLLEGKLEQAAERAVAAAVNARVTAAVNDAVKAIENFSQASVRQVEAYCGKYRETMMTSAREELLARLQADLFQAGELLRKKVEESSERAQETVQQLQKNAAQVQPMLSEAHEFLQGAAREVQKNVLAQLRESVDKANVEFAEEGGRISQKQLARLAEKAHAIGGEAARALEARSVEARAHLDSAAATALAEFHQRAGIEIDMELADARESVATTLASFTAETNATWDGRRRACQEELVRAAGQSVEQFRHSLAEIVNSSMLAAVSAVSRHSEALLDSISRETTESVRPRASSANSATQI